MLPDHNSFNLTIRLVTEIYMEMFKYLEFKQYNITHVKEKATKKIRNSLI